MGKTSEAACEREGKFDLFSPCLPYQENSFGNVQNRYLRHSFFSSRIPAAGILPLCVNLAYYERKGIRITPKSIIVHRNIVKTVGKHA